jgi:hypothetical protein
MGSSNRVQVKNLQFKPQFYQKKKTNQPTKQTNKKSRIREKAKIAFICVSIEALWGSVVSRLPSTTKPWFHPQLHKNHKDEEEQETEIQICKYSSLSSCMGGDVPRSLAGA